MRKLFIHNTIFRIISPLLYGILVYILILLVNESVDSLNQNFINQEVLFCIGLTYLIMELFRGQILLMDRYFPIKKNMLSRIFLQFISGILIASFTASIVISIYFEFILEYSKYDTELITFNTIYIISAVLFNMIYISVAYLNMENEVKLQEEEIKRKNLEYQMRAFNNEVNPMFLYSSLETLIGLLYESEEDSELYIEKLSTVYRYILSNKNNELVSLKSEIESTEALLYVLNTKHNHQINFDYQFTSDVSKHNLIPGTTNLLIDSLVNMMIISPKQPLKIKCYHEDGYIVFQVKLNERLTQEQSKLTDNLNEPYQYFTIKPIIELRAYGDLFVKIPLLHLHEESEKLSA